MRAVLKHAGHVAPDFVGKYMPTMTKGLIAFLPEWEYAGPLATVVFGVGCGWLSWQERPGVLSLVTRLLIGFVLVGTLFAYMPLIHSVTCLCSDPPGYSMVDEFIWILLCCLPLIAAVLKHREGKVAIVSPKD